MSKETRMSPLRVGSLGRGNPYPAILLVVVGFTTCKLSRHCVAITIQIIILTIVTIHNIVLMMIMMIMMVMMTMMT